MGYSLDIPNGDAAMCNELTRFVVSGAWAVEVVDASGVHVVDCDSHEEAEETCEHNLDDGAYSVRIMFSSF